MRNNIQKDFGWFFNAEEVSKFTNESYFTIMEKPAIEILGIMNIMRAKIEMIK